MPGGDDEGYVGGFAAADIEDLLDLMERNHLGWQDPLAGMVAGPGQAADKKELDESFCRSRPEVAAQFAAVTFRADNRGDLTKVDAPTLVLQSREDAIAPMTAGTYVHEQIQGSQFEVIDTIGHCPHLSAPGATVAAIQRFVSA